MRSTVMHTIATPRPRAKGWIHFYSALVAGVTGVALTTAALGVGPRATVACAVYAVTIVALFSVSATYHRRVWLTERSRIRMKRLDHAMIFLFIAGTYTPIAVLALPPGTAGWVLPVVWGGALTGATLKLSWNRFPRWLGVPIYLALGWVAVFIVPGMHDTSGAVPVALMCAGGLLYTVGTAMFALRRPNPWPGVFGFHEMFHACVSLAAACHCVAIWLVLFD